MHVVAAVGDHDGQPLPVQHPAQERDQVTGGAVGPVQVLEDQQHRAGLGQLGEQAEHRPEQLLLRQPGRVAARRLGAAGVGQQPGQHRPGGQRVTQRAAGQRAGRRVPQRVGERQVRDGVRQLRAAAGEHREAAVPGLGRQLGHQAGLADPGIAADQRHDRAAGGRVAQQRTQAAELGLAANQTSSLCPGHVSIIPARSDILGPRDGRQPGPAGAALMAMSSAGDGVNRTGMCLIPRMRAESPGERSPLRMHQLEGLARQLI